MFQIYVSSVASKYFKVDGIAHGMRVGSETGHERSPRERRSAARAPAWPLETQAWASNVWPTRAMRGRAKTDCNRGYPDAGVRLHV
jgi:hypothetical protein